MSRVVWLSWSSLVGYCLCLALIGGCAKGSAGSDAGGADALEVVDAGKRPDSSVSTADGGDGCGVGGTVNSCCGTTCPGIGASNSAPSCESDGCVFRCAGENYDVNADLGDGCEQTDVPTGNHTTGGAVDLGSKPCDDGSSDPNISGVMISDLHEHDPVILGFDAVSGAAPDQYKLAASGGLCFNDLELGLRITGSSNPSCYELSVVTSVSTYTCAGDCNISQGQGSYGDGTNIVLSVRKTCPATTVTERVIYTVSGHL